MGAEVRSRKVFRSREQNAQRVGVRARVCEAVSVYKNLKTLEALLGDFNVIPKALG